MKVEFILLGIIVVFIVYTLLPKNCYDRADAMSTRFHNSHRVYKTRSQYQTIEVYKDKLFGHILCIDGDIQLSEYDEHNYHEMLVHVPMAYLKSPQNVLIIGGGDGGTLREVCKYPSLVNIVMVEIDDKVVEAAKQYFVQFRSGFEDPRVSLKIMDAFHYLREEKEILFDAIFVDVTDFNQSDKLFTDEAITNVRDRMQTRSVLGLNYYSIGLNEPNPMDELRNSAFGSQFRYKRLYLSHQPVFTGGLYSFAFMSDTIDPLVFPMDFPIDDIKFDTEYYTKDVHRASFALPRRLQ